jgi:hypothetical protein
MSIVPGYEGPAHPLSPHILKLYLPFALLRTTTELLELGTTKVHSILQVRFLVVAILSKSSPPPKSGLFLMVGPLQKS